MSFENVSEELKAKAMACKSTEELFELAKAEGIELAEEELSQLSGGMEGWGVPNTCPNDNTPLDPTFDNI